MSFRDSKKQLTLQDVADAVVNIFDVQPSTTTLDIKNVLRASGFWATQSDVAMGMYSLWSLFQWHWTYNGQFRTYYPDLQSAIDAFNQDSADVVQTSWLGWIVADTTPDSDSANDTVASPASPPIDKSALVDGSPRITTTPKPGDWVAFSYSQVQSPAYVTGVTLVQPNGVDREVARLTVRNLVRNFYSDLEQVPYIDVGANIIK